jgi:Protein of unknown function (DUF4058)
MKSPFPGMDSYIETSGLWEDFHNHLVEKVGERLADAAPDRYLVRTGERSYVVLVESESKKSYAFLPDVSVQRPLPAVCVPLAHPDPDLSVEIQPMIDGIYERFRYERSIDYARPLNPPLTSDEATWFERKLKAKRRQA